MSRKGDSEGDRHAQGLTHPSAQLGSLTYMATVTRTYMIDDLDGSEDDVSTVLFALDKKDYAIDLSAANAERLREKLAKFVDTATPVKSSKARLPGKTKPHTSERGTSQEIREWARANGYGVSDRGRISQAVWDAFDEVH